MTNNTTLNVGDKVYIKHLTIYPEGTSNNHERKRRGLVVGNTGTVVGILSPDAANVRTDNAVLPSDTAAFGMDTPDNGWFFFASDLEKVES